MMNGDDRIDLSPLDPENDPLRLERVVAGVLDGLGPGLVRDPESMAQHVTEVLARRFRPIFGAAVITALAASLVLLMGRSGPGVAQGEGSGLMEVPPEWQAWMGTGEAPATEELLFSFAGEVR